MSEEDWADLGDAIYDVQSLISWVKDHNRHLDEITKESMESVIVELKFLCIFVGYAHRWSDAASSSSSRDTNMNSLFFKVAVAGIELKSFLQHDFIDRFRHNFTAKLLKWCRRASRPLTSKPSKLLHVLNQKITLLKPWIGATYYDGSLSTQSFHPHPPSSRTSSFAWYHFYRSLESMLRYLSEDKTPFLGDPLKMQMKALERSLNFLSWLLSTDDYDWSPWRDNMLAHCGSIAVQVAHFCCWCWYNAPVDQGVEQDMVTSLSDLQRRMDPNSPEFLEMALGFLGHYDGKDSEKSISSFVYYIHGVRDEGEVLHKELVSLLTCLIKIPEVHEMDMPMILVRIKDVVMEARYLRHKYQREHYTSYAILFAKIWSLKAEIFIKSCGTLLTLSKDDHVEALHEGHRYLDQIFSPTDENSIEYQISVLVEGVPEQVESLYKFSHAEDCLVDIKTGNLLFKSLVQIMLLKGKALLLELLEKDASLMLPLKHKIGTLHGGLFFLLDLVINKTKENTEDDKLILIDFEVVATEVISLCNTFLVDNLTKEGIKNMDVWLLDLLEKVQHLMSKVKGLYLQIPRLNLPETPVLCFIELFLPNLRDLLSHQHDLLAHATQHVEAICRDLEYIVSTFQDVFEQGIEKQECKDLHTQLADVAYQVEHVIDLMLGEKKAVWQHSLWLYHLSEEIRCIQIQLANFDVNNYNDGVHNVPSRLMPVVSHVSTATIEAVMVGLNDKKEEIINRLTRGTLQRDIVSLVGMPGIGKTTLANNVFYSPSVLYHFHIRAWCCVSQKYKKRDLLLDILNHIITITDNTHAMNDTDLEELVYKQLKGKRYLIIMDDVWSTTSWDDLQFLFPNDSNGSRILLTSRLEDVVSKISDPHPLRPLSEVESWKLLNMKIFQEEECPKELLEVGQQIAKNCKGLPLAIRAIAGLLERTCGRSQDLWKQIAESVSSLIVNDPETQCKRILELSYNHLPDHLKACFLYFGTFPEDKDIPVQRLQRLWIAEGFVRKLESRSLEDLAEDYLMDLVGRNLVMVAKRRSNGKVKACRVHDVVRDLCLLKAKDDRFLQLITANDEPYSSFDGLRYGVLYERFNTSNSITYEQYRLYFCVDREQFVVSRPFGSFVRSLIFSATTDMSPRCSYDISFISNNFEHLRVLDLESINMGSSFGNGIELLVHLRYLAVCGDMESIPPSLSKLQNLETFLMKGLKRKVALPHTIWRMKKLRHVHVSNYAIISLPNDENGRSFQLDSLVTLSLPYFSLGEETNEIILKFPNLRKLKCVFSEPIDFAMNFCWVSALGSLHQLESLKISYYGKTLNSSDLNLPSGLKKLTLSNFCPSWSHISEIGRLQNLEVLKLISCSFEGSSWDMTEGEFLKLKYLKLDNLNIVHWNACSEHLPNLQQLVLRNCKQLENVPFDFMSISTLEKIEVQLCGNSVNQSARKIEEQEIEGLNIVINNSHSA